MGDGWKELDQSALLDATGPRKSINSRVNRMPGWGNCMNAHRTIGEVSELLHVSEDAFR